MPSKRMQLMLPVVAVATVVLLLGGSSPVLVASMHIPIAIRCSINQLAWEYSKTLLPERAPFVSVFDALQLGAVCNLTRPTELAHDVQRRVLSQPSRRLYQQEQQQVQQQQQQSGGASGVTVYVDAEHGSDSNSGTLQSPLRTVHAALSLTRSKDGNSTIVLRAGTYYLQDTITLTSSDNGLSIVNYAGEAPVLSGGRVLKTEQWMAYDVGYRMLEGRVPMQVAALQPRQNCTGVTAVGKRTSAMACQNACSSVPHQACTGYVWYASTAGAKASQCYLVSTIAWSLQGSSESAPSTTAQRLNVWSVDISNQGGGAFTQVYLGNGTERAIRARHPNGNPETTGLQTKPSGYIDGAVGWWKPAPFAQAYNIEIASPNRTDSYFPTFGVGEGGTVTQFVPPVSYWGQTHPVGGSQYHVPRGLVANATQFPTVNWTRVSSGLVHAFHLGHWGNWMFQLDGMSPGPALPQATVNFTWSYGGFQEARGDTRGSQYYVENVLELLDTPQEWYLDRQCPTTHGVKHADSAACKETLYFYPNGTNSLPSSVVVPVLETLVALRGSQDAPVVNVTLSGLTFAHSTTTFMKGFTVPSGGDWSAYRGAAVVFEGAEQPLVAKSLFRAPGGNGLLLSNYVRGAQIVGNEFVYTGASAIVGMGSSQLIDGTDGNQPRGTLIEGNLAHEIGVWVKQAGALYQGLTAETTVRGNVFFNGARAGINLNDGFGGGHLIERNLLFNFVRETSDHGPINTWDRQPYVTRVRNGTRSLVQATSNITRNFLINNYNSVWPIDHDDGSCYYLDTFNFMAYGGFKNYLGHSKVARSNVYAYTDAISNSNVCCYSEGDQWNVGWGDAWQNNTCVMFGSEVYTYGWSCDLPRVPATDNNKLFTNSGTAYVMCGTTNYTMAEYTTATGGYDTHTKVATAPSLSQVLQWGREVLQM